MIENPRVERFEMGGHDDFSDHTAKGHQITRWSRSAKVVNRVSEYELGCIGRRQNR